MPNSLRQLFCTILVFCGALSPKELLLKFEEPLTEDYVKKQKMVPIEARQCLLRFVKSTLESMGKTLQDFGLDDLLVAETQHDRLCKEILDEQHIDVSELDLLSVSKLNSDQTRAYREILQAVRKNDGTCFFIDGPGGTGKTFLYRALLATIRSTKSIALATATSGVAPSILPNGRTAHSRFKIPLERDRKLTCNVGKQTSLAKLLRATSLIIWDEASMAKRQIIEALDNLLRDITEVDSLFGGKVVVLGGDFRQVLPVIPKGFQLATKGSSTFSFNPPIPAAEKLRAWMSEHPSETAGEEDAEEDIFELEEDVTQPPLKKQRAPRSKDGLKVIASLVSKIRDSVRYLKRSPSGKQKFDLAVSQLKLNGLKKVPMDVSIRWNSTYEMLEAALPLRDAFARLDLIDKNYDHNPSDEEWEIATIIYQDAIQPFVAGVITKQNSNNACAMGSFTEHEGEIMATLEGPFPIVLGARLKANNYQHKTGSIVATVFPQDAEGMFGIIAEYTRENIQQGDLSAAAIEKLCQGVEYAVQV
ncbi:hypothetical protein RHGRI_010040 [Rhododendron griersonianum]|uniref:ATP-dependent DNA helicase n=1 Tax=Rhododendron griersonianum TaxID=479676 RepID=A0AAV6KH01_9ERIC|nr:hypothetical protein RHGRI_010040 [Rhododendron griersonianum]